MIFDDEIELLGRLLSTKAYIVGGCVRNRLMGLDVSDVDVASAALPKEVIEKASPAFSGVLVNERLGTVKLTSKNSGAVYEHTTFRVDSYPKSGRHLPKAVRFTSNLEEDALRRDFTVNALYFEPESKTVIDPTGGTEDIQKKLLRAADSPEKVFGEDGLRIMRLARFSAELGFSPEEKTFAAAKNNVRLLADVSKDRIWPELEKIFAANEKYPTVSGDNAVKRGLEVLEKLGALRVLFPNYSANEGYLAALEAMPHLAKEARLAALFTSQDDKDVFAYLSDLRCPKCLKEQTANLIALAKTAVKTREDAAAVILKSENLWKSVALLKRHVTGDVNGADILEKQFSYMAENELPFDVKGLFVTGNDLIKLKIAKDKRSAALKKLLCRVAVDKGLNSREKQLQLLLEEV